MTNARWEGIASRIYYSLGALYYAYEWLALATAGSALTALTLYLKSSTLLSLAAANISLILLIITVAIWLRYTNRRIRGRNPALQVLTLDYSYDIFADNKYRTTKGVTAKALYNGVDHYRHAFVWTGAGDISARAHVPEDGKITLSHDSLGPKQLCQVHFERPLARGEETQIKFTLDLVDSAKTSQPFFALTSYDWIQKDATLRVRFHTERPATYTKRIYLSDVAT
jgi:hypothetical protein